MGGKSRKKGASSKKLIEAIKSGKGLNYNPNPKDSSKKQKDGLVTSGKGWMKDFSTPGLFRTCLKCGEKKEVEFFPKEGEICLDCGK